MALVIDGIKVLSLIYRPCVVLSAREPFTVEILEYFDCDVSAYSCEISKLGNRKRSLLSEFNDVFFYEL